VLQCFSTCGRRPAGGAWGSGLAVSNVVNTASGTL
jgi:hypothetical protein